MPYPFKPVNLFNLLIISELLHVWEGRGIHLR